MTFGEEWGYGASKEVSRQIFDAFLQAGGNFIDTADLYTNGTSERYLGEFIQGEREHLVLSTKYSNGQPGRDPNAVSNQRKNLQLHIPLPMVECLTRSTPIVATHNH